MKVLKKIIITILVFISLILLLNLIYWEYIGYKLEHGWQPYIHKTIDDLKKEANSNN